MGFLAGKKLLHEEQERQRKEVERKAAVAEKLRKLENQLKEEIEQRERAREEAKLKKKAAAKKKKKKTEKV